MDLSTDEKTFLPNFCEVRIVFAGVILGQLMAFVLTLSPLGKPGYRWEDLAFISLFIQWVVLSSAAVLCLSRGWLSRLSNNLAGLLSYLLVLAITFLLIQLAWHMVIRPTADPGVDLRLQYHLFLFRNMGISAIVSAAALRYLYVHYHWKLKIAAEARARVQALQSRINPHFLFNGLNSIASLTRTNPALAEQMVEDLADLFRSSLADASALIPLEKELSLCRHYLRIETLRMGERLKIEWTVDMLPGDALVPTLCLQPLLENAVSHGIQPIPAGGVIRINGLTDGQLVKIEIENPLPDTPALRKGAHIAQDNLRQRLEVYYGRHGRLDISVSENSYVVKLRFPYKT
ncbi:MAG: sensor histidine kinase [Gammaproteobacteria bacterium]|nr:sensor histidine kinase [Gammaproteobacteria bacterium]